MGFKKEKKKVPSDYPLLSFRCSLVEKEHIDSLIKTLKHRFNRGLQGNQKKIKKNDIAIQALYIGLGELNGRKL